ncbi:hypothetical protein QCA50_006373 [Cerrena zonata]|uniref:Uncharacterized protein n=1 Tax=Cerrena zonata TaxID=2478898 RepID=A0AAW0GEH7_9APHY
MITIEMSPYSTHLGNATKCPRQVVFDADHAGRMPCRSSKQVKQDCIAVEAQASALEEECLVLMKRIAELEAVAYDQEDQKVGPSVSAILKDESYKQS